MRGVLGPTQVKGVCSVNSAATQTLILNFRVPLPSLTGTSCGGKHWVRPARQDGVVLFLRFDLPLQRTSRNLRRLEEPLLSSPETLHSSW
jgi:hypothetical protein